MLEGDLRQPDVKGKREHVKSTHSSTYIIYLGKKELGGGGGREREKVLHTRSPDIGQVFPCDHHS